MCFEVFEELEDGFSNINVGAISHDETYSILSKAYWTPPFESEMHFSEIYVIMIYWNKIYFGCTLCKSILKIKKSNVTLLLFENWMRWVF